MTLKEKLSTEPGFQYVVDSLELMSAAGRRRMLLQPFITDEAELNAELGNVARVVGCLCDENNKRPVSTLRHQLMQMHDLQGTLNNLRQHIRLEEIELFEIKTLTLLCAETMRAATEMGIADLLSIPDVSDVFKMLDPDDTGLPSFYVYDSYHPDLGELRRQLRAMQTHLDGGHVSEEERAQLQCRVNDLFDRQNVIQQQVVARLSDSLTAYHQALQAAHDRMAYTDFLFAKATLAAEWGLVCPVVVVQNAPTQLVQMWNPRLKKRNEEQGLRYQPIDIVMNTGTCLITGANMAGKTVLLKTVGILQMMVQFGFFVPARQASVRLVDDVVFCIGDEQNEMNGLSSFASEIIKISDALTRASEEHLLILVDEPARTTNPIEGKAIVQALASLLERCQSLSLITTHYSQLGLACRRLRVRGFVESTSDERLTPANINRFIDYSLLPDDSDDVPQEAIRIATILRCNTALLSSAKQFLDGHGPS